MDNLIPEREEYCRGRLDELRRRLRALSELKKFPDLVVFATGSYPRLDASKHSDVDLFFVNCGNTKDARKIDSILMFSQLIEAAAELEYPPFSSDGQYLEIHDKSAILAEMGGRKDDHMNYFTARMLLLLESTYVFNEDLYNTLLSDVVSAYCRDYPGYEGAFSPTFLVNDIIRFWKTLCLNYEFDRNSAEERKAHVLDDTIRNFKLKFSRLLTCFSMVSALAADGRTIRPEAILALAKATPRQRLAALASRGPEVADKVSKMTDHYRYFLEKTHTSRDELRQFFGDPKNEEQSLARAREFGDTVFDLLQCVTRDNGYLRYAIV